jgi:hypothetical protein
VIDQWPLIIAGAVTALITYALPKLIEGVFRQRVTASEAEAAQESLEETRWKKAQRDNADLLRENAKLRTLLRRCGIEPSEALSNDDGEP